MRKETIITKKVKRYKYYCDICGKEVCSSKTLYGNIKYCGLCRRCICSKCSMPDVHPESANSDYPDSYCESCYNTFMEYKPLLDDLDIKIEELHYKWEAEAKERAGLQQKNTEGKK